MPYQCHIVYNLSISLVTKLSYIYENLAYTKQTSTITNNETENVGDALHSL